MAGALLPRSGGGKRAPRRFTPMTEINVTPFVDVMLVLLIVFMVTAPLLTAGVELKLPKSDAKALPAETAPLTLSITTDGKIYIGGAKDGEEIAYDELTPKLKAISSAREEGDGLRIYLRADEATAYGAVIKVMARVRNAGFANIALVTDPLPESPR